MDSKDWDSDIYFGDGGLPFNLAQVWSQEMYTETINQINSWIVFLESSSCSISIWIRVTIYPGLSKFMPLSWLYG